MKLPRVFGFPLYRGMKKRQAKKFLKKEGDLLSKFKRLSRFKQREGDLINTCTGFNSKILEIYPEYFELCGHKGKLLSDIVLITNETTCSASNCGIEHAISYELACKRKEHIVEGWKDNDEWGFSERYSNAEVLPDGSIKFKSRENNA